ncbi:MAG: ATP-binding protein [Desulfobacterales bacterium]
MNLLKDDVQQLFETVPCTISVQDRDYRLVRYNRAFAVKFNPEPGDFCYRAYKGRTSKCENCPVEKTFADGGVHYSEEQGLDKDGSLVYWIVKTSPIYNDGGDIIAAMEMCIDITESKLLEDKLKKTEKKYHAIFNTIPNPVFVLDRKSLEILDCNASAPVVYGCNRTAMLNRSFMDFFVDSEKAPYRSRLQHDSAINRVRHIGGDNRTVYVDIRVSALDYPGRNVLLVTANDITHRLEVEQQLIQAGKMATIGQMATGVAHELNQPLSVIKTAGTFLMSKIEKGQPIDPDILHEVVYEMDQNVDRAVKIINHIRQFGRKSDLVFGPVDVNRILSRSVDIFSEQLSARGIHLQWEIEEHLPEILADPDRLEQVFINLLVNARDALEEKFGRRPDADTRQEIILRSCRSADAVIIEVCDNGIGIPEWAAEKIFEPFFTTKEAGKGTGLGLSISDRIVKECGGKIFVSSEPSRGTVVRIAFSINEEANGR